MEPALEEVAVEAAVVQPTLEEQLAAAQGEVARLLAAAAQNGADARGGGDAEPAAPPDANARGGLPVGPANGAVRSEIVDPWDRRSSVAGSGFGLLAPPPHKGCVGSFGKADPNSPVPGLSKMWSRALTDDPAKAAKIFREGESAKLASFEVIGRSRLLIQEGLRDCVNTVLPDNEAVGYLLEFDDELDRVLDKVRKELDEYVLRWKHPTRYSAIKRFTAYYEHDTLGGPACMLETNLNLEYQITLSDLKAIKKEVKQDAPRGGGGGRGARESRGGGRAGGDASQARNRRERQGAATGATPNQGPAQPQRFGRGGGPSASSAGPGSG